MDTNGCSIFKQMGDLHHKLFYCSNESSLELCFQFCHYDHTLHRRRILLLETTPSTDKETDELRGLISGDLYRAPTVAPMIFAVLVGTGVQLGSALTLVVLAACAGVVDPAERGSMLSAFLFVGAVCGLLGGYVTSRLGGSFQGHSHDGSRDFRSSIWTGVLVPGVVVMFPYCIINTLLSLLGSTRSGAPLQTQ